MRLQICSSSSMKSTRPVPNRSDGARRAWTSTGWSASGRKTLKTVPSPTVDCRPISPPSLSHDREHGGESEPGAVLLRREEGVPDFLEMLGRDPGAVVADLELDVVARRQRRHLPLGDMDVVGLRGQPRLVRRWAAAWPGGR